MLSLPRRLCWLAVGVSCCTTAIAQFDFAPRFSVGAGVAITNDYVYRGVSQTQGSPAIQGSVEITYDIRFSATETVSEVPQNQVYINIWASNVDFNEGTEEEADLEVDLTLGFRNSVLADDALTYDVGIVRYLYPDTDSNLNYNEYFLKLAYAVDQRTALFADYFYSNDVFATSEDGSYYRVGVGHDIPDIAYLSGYLGYSDFDGDVFGDDVANSYLDWGIAVSRDFEGLNVEVAYTDTDDDGEEMFGNDADAQGTVTLSAEF